MRVYPIYHSGFFVELERCCLLFDYYRGAIPAADPGKPLYVFVSHGHHDHFHPALQTLTARWPIRHFFTGGVAGEGFHVMAPGDTETVDGVTVTALDSTDEGVSFLVRAAGKTIFHAGDLNLWYWEGDTPAERAAMTRRYEAVLEQLRGVHLDLAFLVLDSRQAEADATAGIDRFQAVVGADHIFPMHFGGDEARMDRRLSLLRDKTHIIDPRRKPCYDLSDDSRKL